MTRLLRARLPVCRAAASCDPVAHQLVPHEEGVAHFGGRG